MELAITYKQIAEIVGVSRGTVDRALNNRGRVNPEVAKRIKQVAEEHGFAPSHVGRALARAKNPVKIGVVVHLTKISFFQEVISGIMRAKGELANLGGEVLVREISNVNPEQQMQAVSELMAEGIQGLAISPAEHDGLRDQLNSLARDKHLPIVTFNTDMEQLDRKCFVGMDNVRSGQTAAGLMNLLLAGKGGQVLVISGNITNQANNQRLDGFVKEIASRFPQITVPSIMYSMDEDENAYQIVRASLQSFPDLAAIYMISSGHAGACRALEELGRGGEIKLIVFDTVPDTVHYIKKGIIDFILDQNAFEQGNLPPRILFDLLFDNKPVENERVFTDISIRTMYNV